jgi:hypothetical protein
LNPRQIADSLEHPKGLEIDENIVEIMENII